MIKKILFSVITIALLLFLNLSFSQTPNGTANLGILTSFEAFTGAGAVANSGGTITGDVGTHLGIVSGLNLPAYTGNAYNGNTGPGNIVTTQARYDLLRLYIHLNDKFVDFPAFPPAFGAGQTITPGVYSTIGAGSIGGALTLDGGGNPDAFFVIKMNGAMTVGAAAAITLINGAKSCNVFWIINGAISVAAAADIKGTLFSKTGAVGLGAGTLLEGRMLTMSGAITLGIGAIATLPPCASTIPIFCEASCSPAPSVDVLGSLSNFTLFASVGNVGNTGISGINGNIGTNAGAITGYTNGIHIGTEQIMNTVTAQAALDLDAAYLALMALTATGTGSATYLNETITPGVYAIPTAGALGGTITLDAGGNPDAIFVFRFAGAFNIAASSKMILTNGARRCNIFWLAGAGVATGALNIGASAEIKGNFIAHGGACNSGGGVFMSGRQFSTLGAVNTDNAVIYNSPECITSTSLGAPIIIAVAETTAAINGVTGGTTTSLTSNDTLNGTPVVIGTAAGNVTLTGLTVPTGLTLNANGTVTIAPNTAVGNYSLTYSICEFSNPTNCSSVTSTIVVSAAPAAPLIALVKTASVSGTGIVGNVITYTFTVTNIGNTTLTNVAVTDPMVGLTITGSPIASLAPGASSSVITGTYTITQANITAGSVSNSATVTTANGVSDISGTTIANDTQTVTATPTLIPAVADFTPTIDIDATLFSGAAPTKDFVINISAIGGLASNGPVVVKISKPTAFTISYNPTATSSNVFGGTTVNNSNWIMTQNSYFITMTLKSGAIIGGSENSAIGFTITRNTTAPTQTIQSITATIVNGSGSDAVNNNNTYSTIANVQ
jgi:hypothetical protein